MSKGKAPQGVIHAEGWQQGGEFTLCGLAFDAFDSGDESEPVNMAAPGELVTCEDCRRAIDYAKTFKRYRQPPA